MDHHVYDRVLLPRLGLPLIATMLAQAGYDAGDVLQDAGTMLELVAVLEGEAPLGQVAGLSWRDPDGRLHHNQPLYSWPAIISSGSWP